MSNDVAGEDDWTRHLILVTSLGQAVVPADSQKLSIEPKNNFDDIFASIESDANRSKTLIFFIQGGLDDLDSAIARAKDAGTIAAMASDNFYPIFIGWDANLGTSYLEHLKTSRGIYEPGNYLFTTPLTLIADLGEAVSNAPLSFFHQFFETDAKRLKFASSSYTNDTVFRPISGLNPEAQVVNNEYAELRSYYNAHPERSLKIELANFCYSPERAIAGSATYIVSFVPKTAMLPILQGGGLGAWQRMRGRVINLFHRPYEFDLLDKGYHLTEADFREGVLPDDAYDKSTAERAGGLALFMAQLQAYQLDHKQRQIILVGHSAGTIVASEMLLRYPDIKYADIVYMAAACSLNDFEKSVLPYLKRHKSDATPTLFYDLCLHPQHEVDEWRLQEVTLGNGAEEMLAERGSLLEWIDNFYSTPESFMDRMLGKWENIVQASHIIPYELRPLITVKGFGASPDALKAFPNTGGAYNIDTFYKHRDTGPQAHGDFSWWPYWKTWMWEVEPSLKSP